MKNIFLSLLLLIGMGSLMAQRTFQEKQKNARSHQNIPVDLVIDGRQNPSAQVAPLFRSLPSPTPDPTAASTISHWQVEAKVQENHSIFLKRKPRPTNAARAQPSTEELSQFYLREVAGELQIADPDLEMRIQQIHTDALGHTHVRLQQYYQDLPIYGAEGVLHLAPAHIRLNGHLRPTPSLRNASPGLSQRAAIQTAVQDVSQYTTVRSLSQYEKNIIKYQGPEIELVWYQAPEQQELKLTYVIELRPNFLYHWKYFIDAQTGEILNAYDHTCSIGPTTGTGTDLNGVNRTIDVFEGPDGNYILLDASKGMYSGPTNTYPDMGDGYVITVDMNNTSPQNPNYNEIVSANNTWNSQASVSAHYNASLCYDYFWTTFNRQSIDGNGGDIISFINVAEENGQGMDNAFWNGAAMFYGNGGGAFTPLAGALDVAAHEMGHGVIQNTANLEYQGQSGALNESFADIFGVMVDRNDWALGEDIIPNTANFPTGYLRDVSNPHNGYPGGSSPFSSPGYQPRVMSEIYTGSQDNGGVHINSGIANYAFYLFTQNMNGNKDKAEQVYYRALSTYLTRSSQFVDCRLAVVQSAEDLYGANSAEVQAAKNAFDAIGVMAPGGSNSGGTTIDPNPTIPTNNGQDFVIHVDTDQFTAETFYISDPTPANFQALSNTEPVRRISITDDGSKGYFISSNKQIHTLDLNTSNPNEQILNINNLNWDNVAVSKDGNKLALISVNIDTSIYVVDLVQQQIAKFRLYNPTTAQGGIQAGGVLYADAIEWDYSGEYILYDAFNAIPNNTGDDIEYWDVGFMRVWDNGINSWGDGYITKLFILEPGESVGNAVYAKNSPNIIAFDYVNANTGEANLMAANVETGEIGTIFQNSMLSFPSYSKNDDKIIFNGQDQSNISVLGILELAPNKIEPKPGAQATIFIGQAKWGVWFTIGQRPLSVEDDLANDLKLRVAPNPFQSNFKVLFELDQPADVQCSIQNLMGQRLFSTLSEKRTAGPQEKSFDLSYLSAGTYFLQVRAGERVQTLKVVKY
jgi:bacillolysin